MSTRSSIRNLFPPLDNPELKIQRRSRADPALLNDFKMAAEGNGDPPVPDLRTMKELCQPSLNGRGGPIASISIQATNFRLKNDMIQHLKNEISNFRQRPDESLFEAWERYKLSIDRCPNHNMLPVTQIDTFYNGLTLRHRDTINAAACGTFMKRRPEECYDLIENMTAHHNDWILQPNRVNQQAKAVTPSCETCGDPHSYNDCPATVGQTQNVYVAGAYQGGNSYQPQELPESKQESRKQSSSRKQPRKKPILPRSWPWSKPASSLSSTGLSSPGLPSSGSSTPDSSTASCDYH
nr:reverse transcriptase domain-containing protein [Tanacetum cinerariifolium]